MELQRTSQQLIKHNQEIQWWNSPDKFLAVTLLIKIKGFKMKNLSSTEIRENEQANILRSIARKKLNLFDDPETERRRTKEKNQAPEILEYDLPDFTGLEIPATLRLYNHAFIVDLPLYIKDIKSGLEQNLNATNNKFLLRILKDIHSKLTGK